MDVTYNTSLFKNSSIVIGNTADVLIDDAFISSADFLQISEDTLDADGVRIFFIDTILGDGVDLILPGFCRIDCHQIVDDNMSLIRQLVAHCNASHSHGVSVKSLLLFQRNFCWSFAIRDITCSDISS